MCRFSQLNRKKDYKLRIVTGEVVLEISVQKRGCERTIYQSGRVHTECSFHMTVFYDQDADLEDPILSIRLSWWLNGKESTCQCRRHRRHGFYPWVGKIPWRRKIVTHCSFSCLRNAMDRASWQAIVHGVVEGHSFVTKQQIWTILCRMW